MKNKLFKCFEIKNETQNSADLYLYGDIVSDGWGAWQDEDQYPDKIKNFLSGVSGKTVNVYINSGGGSVFAGIAIYNIIKRFAQSSPVQIYVDGLAGSIASIIAFAGSSAPKIPENAFLMIHNPWTVAEGNSTELRKQADALDTAAEGMRSIYMEHVKDGVTEETIRELMEAETWLTGTQAAEYFEVETTPAVEMAAATGEYQIRAHNIPKDFKIQQEAKNGNNDDVQAKRDKIARLIINNM